MVRWSRISSFLIIAVTLASLALPGTATASYITKPATEVYQGEMEDVEKVTFWDLSPWEMLLYSMLMVLPACLCPGELFYLLSTLLPFGFRRVTRRTVLDDDFRLDLYQEIAANPGAGTVELSEMTGASRGRLRYHLNVLIREGKVAIVDYRNSVRHFARNQRHTDLEQRILINLREEPSRTILGYLLGSPDTDRNDVAERLGLSGPAVSRQMQGLETEGIITADKDGRFVRYRLSNGAREFLNRHMEDIPFPRHPGTENYPATRGHEALLG
jgi:predicted transcriptional regulator